MSWLQSISHVLLRGSSRPLRVARVRILIGVWLLILTAVLMTFDHGVLWAWPLVAVAMLHFGLAFRLVRSDEQHA